nr:DUF6493 family protein [Streptomyces sp. AC495_CC817]
MSTQTLLRAVRAGKVSDVVALVDGMTDTERRACVPELKQLRRELRAEPWRSPAQRAYPALHVAGAACQTGAAAVAAWLTGSDLRWRQAPPAVLIEVLGDRDPEWLGELVRRLAERPLSARVQYELMAGLVRLAGCPVPTSEAYVRGWMDHVGRARRPAGTVIGNLRGDPHLAELVAALFETEEVGARSAWRYDVGPNDWTYALTQLTREGLLDRKAMVDGCVARLLRGGGSTADDKVFLGLLTALDLTRDERLERIADWTALCADASSTVAAHAQAVLAHLVLDGGLGPRRLAELTDAVLFRTEKKLVRAQLVLLGRALKKDASLATDVLPVVAGAFGHEDTDVQERALKLVQRHLGDLGDLGRNVEAMRAREEIADHASRLSPGLRARAQQLLGASMTESAPEAYEELLPPVPSPTRLAPAPESVAEVAEEVGALLVADGEVGAFERALDGLVRHAHRNRDALVEALRPAAARLWWADLAPESVDRYFSESPTAWRSSSRLSSSSSVRSASLRSAMSRPTPAVVCTAARPTSSRRGCGRSRTASGPTRCRSCSRRPPGAPGRWRRRSWWSGSTSIGGRVPGPARRTSRRRCCVCGARTRPRSRPPRRRPGGWGRRRATGWPSGCGRTYRPSPSSAAVRPGRGSSWSSASFRSCGAPSSRRSSGASAVPSPCTGAAGAVPTGTTGTGGTGWPWCRADRN